MCPWAFCPPRIDIGVAEGHDLVFIMGPAKCRANFDDRDYPTLGPDGQPTSWSSCRIARAGARGVSLTISVNGKPLAIDTFTASADGQTLTQIGGLVGQPPKHTVVYDRQR